MKTPLHCLPTFFQILSNPPVVTNPQLHCSFCCYFSLFERVIAPHIWCAILLNDIMDPQISNLGTSVPEGPWYVFYATRHQVYSGLTHVIFCWYSGMISDTQIHKQTDTQHSQWPVDWHIHINTYLHHLFCAQKLSSLHWMNNFTYIKNLFSKMFFLFKNYSLVKIIYLLILYCETRFLLWNTIITDRNGVKKQNTHIKHSGKDNTGKIQLVWK